MAAGTTSYKGIVFRDAVTRKVNIKEKTIANKKFITRPIVRLPDIAKGYLEDRKNLDIEFKDSFEHVQTKMSVLSLDGGAIKGLISAQSLILATKIIKMFLLKGIGRPLIYGDRLQEIADFRMERLNINTQDQFDTQIGSTSKLTDQIDHNDFDILVCDFFETCAGTSTGALQAAYLATNGIPGSLDKLLGHMLNHDIPSLAKDKWTQKQLEKYSPKRKIETELNYGLKNPKYQGITPEQGTVIGLSYMYYYACQLIYTPKPRKETLIFKVLLAVVSSPLQSFLKFLGKPWLIFSFIGSLRQLLGNQRKYTQKYSGEGIQTMLKIILDERTLQDRNIFESQLYIPTFDILHLRPISFFKLCSQIFIPNAEDAKEPQDKGDLSNQTGTIDKKEDDSVEAGKYDLHPTYPKVNSVDQAVNGNAKHHDQKIELNPNCKLQADGRENGKEDLSSDYPAEKSSNVYSDHGLVTVAQHIDQDQIVVERNVSPKLADIVQASAAAPSYFPEVILNLPTGYKGSNEELELVDGGVVSNDPTEQVLGFLEKSTKRHSTDFSVLSVGCGYSQNADIDHKKNNVAYFVTILTNIALQSDTYTAPWRNVQYKKNLGGSFLRVQRVSTDYSDKYVDPVERALSIKVDEIDKTDELYVAGKIVAASYSEQMKKLLGGYIIPRALLRGVFREMLVNNDEQGVKDYKSMFPKLKVCYLK